jgi:hypothetical protein
MLNKTLALIGIFLLSIILATAGAATAALSTKTVTDASAKDPPLTLSIIFANGLNTTSSMTKGTNFTVSVDINHVNASNPVGFYTVGIQWNPALLELQHNDTTTDILQASAGNFSSANGWSFANVAADETFLSKGLLDGIAGYNLATNNYGSGTLFTMNFTCKAVGTSYINITSIGNGETGEYTYLTNYLGNIDVDIIAAYNAQLTIVIPEFLASAVLPVFLVVTTVAIAAATVSSRKRRVLPTVSQHG